MLKTFSTWLRPETVLVSYNGRCYDAPLLATRYRLAAEHLDVVQGLWDSWEDDALTPRLKAALENIYPAAEVLIVVSCDADIDVPQAVWRIQLDEQAEKPLVDKEAMKVTSATAAAGVDCILDDLEAKPSEALVGVTSQPPSSSRTLILPDEPGVSPRSNSERPKRQMSSRSFVSLIRVSLSASSLPPSVFSFVSCFGSAAKP